MFEVCWKNLVNVYGIRGYPGAEAVDEPHLKLFVVTQPGLVEVVYSYSKYIRLTKV